MPAPGVQGTAVATSDAGVPAPRAEPFWPCTVCGATNAIELEVCETCGTPFATVMRGTDRRSADPEAARRRSLLFPGAGHTMLGYPIDGFARGALFALSLALALLLLVATPHFVRGLHERVERGRAGRDEIRLQVHKPHKDADLALRCPLDQGLHGCREIGIVHMRCDQQDRPLHPCLGGRHVGNIDGQ